MRIRRNQNGTFTVSLLSRPINNAVYCEVFEISLYELFYLFTKQNMQSNGMSMQCFENRSLQGQ